MNVATLLDCAARVGVTIEAQDGALRLGGPVQSIQDLVPLVREAREALITHLSNPSVSFDAPSIADRPVWCWEIEHADGSTIIHTVTPWETAAEMRAAHPNARHITPIGNELPSRRGGAIPRLSNEPACKF